MHDERSGYRGGVTFAGQWGCMAALLFATVMLVPALMFATLGDCLFERTCDAGGADVFIIFLVLLLVPAAAFGWSVRALINSRLGRKLPLLDPSPSREQGAKERPPLWAVAVVVLALILTGWMISGFGAVPLFGW